MSAPIHLERRWLMDTFGNFLQYDSMSQQLITTPFTPQSFPNLFTFVPVPENFPHRAILRLQNSIPSAIPPARFVRINDSEVAIQNLETNNYLCSRKDDFRTTWSANLDLWEHFSLLSPEMIIGLSLLSDPDLIRISDSASPSHFTFHQKEGYLGVSCKIANKEIKFADNLSEISKLTTCKTNEEIELLLQPYNHEEPFPLKITPKRTLQLTSLVSLS